MRSTFSRSKRNCALALLLSALALSSSASATSDQDIIDSYTAQPARRLQKSHRHLQIKISGDQHGTQPGSIEAPRASGRSFGVPALLSNCGVSERSSRLQSERTL